MDLKKYYKNFEEVERLTKIGHWELDIIKNKLFWSKGIYTIFEKNEEEFEASYEYFIETIHPEDRKLVNDAYSESLINQTSYEIQHRLKFPDGRIKYVVETCSTTFDENNNPIHSIGTCQDVTEKYHLDAKANRLILKLVGSSKLASMGEMAINLCHEVNNPLMAISSALENLKIELKENEDLTKNRINTFDSLDLALNKIVSITSGLKTYMYPGSGDRASLNLQTFFKKELNYLLPLYRKLGIEIEVNLDDTPIHINANISELQQVLLNCLNNCKDALLKITNPKITIELTQQTDKKEAFISIKDNGVGIKKENTEKAFEQFFTTKPIGKGTGIGLNISKKIIKAHGGDIKISPLSPNGTTVEIKLPLEGNRTSSPVKNEAPVKADLTGNILIIDDDAIISKNIQIFCKKHNMEADVCINTKEARDLLNEKAYTCILSDHNLSGEQGGDFLISLKRENSFKGKLFLMTGIPNLNEEYPTLDIIHKPFNLTHLYHKIKTT